MKHLNLKTASLAATCAFLLMLVGCAPSTEQPLEFTVAETGATRPTVAVDAQTGAVYVAWVGRKEGANVYLSRLAPGAEAFSAPVRVNGRPGEAAPHEQAPAQVAVGPKGTVYVAWITQTDVAGRRWPASDIRLARSTDGGRTFSPAITVNHSTALPTGQHFHNLAVGPEGTVYVSWLDSRAGESASHEEHVHTVAHETGNEAHVHDAGTQLRVARSTDGGKHFGEGVVVARGTCQCCRTALAVGPEGTVYVVWRHIFDGQIRDMAIARSTDQGRSFADLKRVHADDWHIRGCPHAGPAVAVDGEGRVHVIWYTGAKGRVGIHYAVSPGGGAPFGPAQALVTGVPVSQVSAATGGRGGVWLAWEDHKADVVRLAHAGPDGALTRLGASLQGRVPSVAAAGGTWVTVWRDGQRVRTRIGQPRTR